MQDAAAVYAEALFAVAKEHDRLDSIREQLDTFAGALRESRDLSVFLFSPYFSSSEKRDGLDRVLVGADPELVNFLALLIEKHRMPEVFRIQRRFEELWGEENRVLDVTVTSAVELDPAVLDHVKDAVESQTSRTVNLEALVDPWVVGGLIVQVGNMVLDASIRNRLEKFRKQVATAA